MEGNGTLLALTYGTETEDALAPLNTDSTSIDFENSFYIRRLLLQASLKSICGDPNYPHHKGDSLSSIDLVLSSQNFRGSRNLVENNIPNLMRPSPNSCKEDPQRRTLFCII